MMILIGGLEENMTKRTRKLLLLLTAALAITAFFAVGCGDDDDDDGDDGEPAATATTGGGDSTPSGGDIDITGIEELDDGELTVGTDGAYAPMEFADENDELTGLAVDLINAMADALGVEVKHEVAGFDTLLPSLDAERYDVVMSSLSVNPERSAIVDFVEYFNAGTGVIVAEGNPQGIQSFDDLCGKRVSVQKGTIQVDYLLGTTDDPGGKNGECLAADRGEITVLEFDTDPEAVQALIAGQADAEIADFPVAGYSAIQNEGEIDLVDAQVEPGPYGIAVRKSSTALRDALQEAFDQLVENGTYDEILEKWDLTAGSIENG
jgi:polar amino acid transport system substrate-binding protein